MFEISVFGLLYELLLLPRLIAYTPKLFDLPSDIVLSFAVLFVPNNIQLPENVILLPKITEFEALLFIFFILFPIKTALSLLMFWVIEFPIQTVFIC